MNYKKVLPHTLVLLCFIVLSIAYFYPVLQGKVIEQSDIKQHVGMFQQQKEFIKSTSQEPYWMDNAFGGMPTYQVGANYPHNYVKELDRIIRFLPRPADYLFIYFIGIYILFLVLKIDPKTALIGALAFGFSTYLIVILGVGHNAKAHAIAYMPLVLAGIISVFNKNYFWGSILLMVGMGLELVANHFQMTFYLMLLCICLGLVYAYHSFQLKEIPHFFKSIGLMVVAVVVALGLNATNLMATAEYAEHSTRGPAILSINQDGKEKKASSSGLSYEYITEYSYGILESFNLLIPNFKGGSSSQDLTQNSNFYEELIQLGVPNHQALEYIKGLPTYWGPQTYVAAPAYLGASLLFLFVLAIFLVKGHHKYWLLGGAVFSLLLSWGDNFAWLTKFFIDYFPLYNKFRAVSSVQVIVELCVPVLAVLGLTKLLSTTTSNEVKTKALKNSILILGGLTLLFVVFGSHLFTFSGAQDAQLNQSFGPQLMRALKEDRKSLFFNDALRSLFFIIATAALVYFFIKNKLKSQFLLIGIGVLIAGDLIFVNQRYVNASDFVPKHNMESPFTANEADLQIKKDESRYRVLDLSTNPFNSARASFFHHSLGGYHAAKPQRIQDIFDFHIVKGNQEVLNMLNLKYEIYPDDDQLLVQENTYANGNAWFVNDIIWVNNANEEILALNEFDSKKQVIINKEFKDLISTESFKASEKAQIKLDSHQPNRLTYSYSTDKNQIAVFSESYYKPGWQVKINNQEVNHFRVNYLLRGLELPKGEGKIEFTFVPQVVQIGSKITLASSLLVLILIGFGVFRVWKSSKQE